MVPVIDCHDTFAYRLGKIDRYLVNPVVITTKQQPIFKPERFVMLVFIVENGICT